MCLFAPLHLDVCGLQLVFMQVEISILGRRAVVRLSMRLRHGWCPVTPGLREAALTLVPESRFSADAEVDVFQENRCQLRLVMIMRP